MRRIFLAATLVAAFATSVIAHATPVTTYDFIYRLNGGSPVSFTLNSVDYSGFLSGYDVEYYPVSFSNGATLAVAFVNPTVSGASGFGLQDFAIVSPVTNFQYYFVGPQLYSGPENDPVFTTGSYTLTGNAFYGTPVTETIRLTISAVPEPSSMFLLGTGVLGCAGAVRRRFFKG